MMGLQVMYVLLLLSTKAFGKGPNHNSAKLPRSPDLPSLDQEAGGAFPWGGIIEGTKNLKGGSNESLKASGSTGNLLSLLNGPGDVPRWNGGFPGVSTILRVGFNGYPGRLPGVIGGFGGGLGGFGSGPSDYGGGPRSFRGVLGGSDGGCDGFNSEPGGLAGGPSGFGGGSGGFDGGAGGFGPGPGPFDSGLSVGGAGRFGC